MRKLLSIFMGICTVCIFSACSSDDKESTPCPVTNVQNSATAEIGGGYDMKGQGFTASSVLTLRNNSTSVETPVLNLTTVSDGVNFIIPSTVEPGVYTIVLSQNGGRWDLAQVRISEPVNPIVSLVAPENIKLNKALEISGIGFSNLSHIFLEATDGSKARTELQTELTSTGVSCTIPASVKPGSYNIVLKHNNIDWVLAENVPAAVYKQLKELKITVAENYDTQKIDMKTFYALLREMGVPEGMEAAYAEMYMGMFKSSEGTVADEQYVYNNQGQVTAIQTNDGKWNDWYTFTYDGNKVTAVNNIIDDYSENEGFVWTLNNGKVENETVTYTKTRVRNFIWNYDDNGFCTAINRDPVTDTPYKTMSYTNGNMDKVGGSKVYDYDDPTKVNNIFGVDVSKALLHSSIIPNVIDEEHRFAACLNLFGKCSKNLPSAIHMSEETTITPAYETDADGYVIKVSWGQAGMDPLFNICPFSSSTIVEFVYE